MSVEEVTESVLWVSQVFCEAVYVQNKMGLKVQKLHIDHLRPYGLLCKGVLRRDYIDLISVREGVFHGTEKTLMYSF